jgi:3-hydroxybutyryl-CoA dehydrogenase
MSESPEFGRVAVLGAGTMGAGIAQVCAEAGSQVVLYDVAQASVDKGLAGVAAFLQKGIDKQKTTPQHRDAVLARIKGTLDMPYAVADVDLVVEAVPEDLALKRELFGTVASLCRADTVLATNTSSLSLKSVFEGIPHPARCVGMHFFNPPPLMKLLEVVRTASAAVETLERVLRYAKQIGKQPILVKDSPGFASSRLGVALGLEAIRMVEEGVAEPEDIDTAMCLGYGHPMGPLRLTDHVGLDVRMAIADYLRKTLDNPAFEVPALMRTMVAKGQLGRKTGQGFYRW